MSLRQKIREIDTGFIVVLAICLLALWPFLANNSLPQETDAELHIFRLVELSSLARQGEWFPRWAPDFYHGYGYPIFNYYAPLTYYVGLFFDLLPGLDPVAGIKAGFILAFLASGFGMYGFVRGNWGKWAGFVATAVFLFSPYIIYIDPHARGVLPELFSFGMFALALWALDSLRRQVTPFRWLASVFTVAAVILSHNLMALLLFFMLCSWVGWLFLVDLWRRRHGQKTNTRWGYLFAALGLGLGLAAFFWLPVFLERNEVNLNTLLGSDDNYDFRTHFLSWQTLLKPANRLDWGATQPDYDFSFGVGQWLLGGLGLLMLLLKRVRHAAHAAFFTVSFAVLLFLLLPVSIPVWETIPFLPYFQFPWRLLGAAAVVLAVLAGIGTSGLLTYVDTPRWQKAWIVGLLLLPILTSLPYLQPAPWTDFGEVNMLRMSLIEQKGRWLGTTSTADYEPVTVDTTPRRNDEMTQAYYEGQPLDRVNRLSLPQDAAVESIELTPLHFQYNVEAANDFMLRLFLFDFPGWQVKVDDELVETELGRPEGFIVVPVPAGSHVVDVRFGSTPSRTLAVIISLISLILTSVGAWWIFKKHYVVTDSQAELSSTLVPTWKDDLLMLTAVIGVWAITVFILYPGGWLHYNSGNYVAEPAQNKLTANFGDEIALIGFDGPSQVDVDADELWFTLYWQAQRPLNINYQNFIHILSPDGVLVAQSDHLNPGEFPTRRWPTDKYVRDEHVVVLPEGGLPVGEYFVKVGLWVQNEGWRLPLFDETGQQIDDGQILYRFSVTDK